MKALLALALMAVQLPLSPAQAAEITARPDLAPYLATLRPIYGDHEAFSEPRAVLAYDGIEVLALSGVIEDGDAERLKTTLGPYEDRAPFVLVMDSPGGSFVEGVRLGEALQPYREGNGDPPLTGVVVLKGAQCMSACAVAFALAALPRDSGFSVRFIEVGARLGFHMPFVPTDQQAAQTEIARAMDLTYEVMSQYIRMVGNGLAPVALVQNALHYRRPEDFFLLEGGLLTRFMDFVPVSGPQGSTPLGRAGLTQRDALNMCQVLAFSAGRRMTADEYDWWSMNATPDVPNETPLDDLFARQGPRLSVTGCTIDARADGTLGIMASGDCGRDFAGTGWCPSDTDGLIPAATGALLADSLGCHGGRLTRDYTMWDWRNAFLEEEETARYSFEAAPPRWPVETLDWTGATLRSTVNMRTGPGGDKVAELAAGTPVTVSDCTLAADGQGTWYQVTAGSTSGPTGWVSARYVTVPVLDGVDFMIRPVGFQ